MRDARPFLQIAHVGRWQTAAEAAITRARKRAWGDPADLRSVARHDPTAVLALREWLEAVTLRDATFRRLPTWMVETGSRTAYGDDESFALARQFARSLAHGASAARVVVAGREDLAGVDPSRWDGRFGVWHPSAPLVQRAPHGGFEVQLFAEDTERTDDASGAARTRAVRDEYSPADRAPVLMLGAGYDHSATQRSMGADVRWVLSTRGDAESLDRSAGATSARDDAARGAQSVVLLRIYASQSQRRAALIERLWFSRPLAIGSFRLLPSLSIERVVALNQGEEP